MTPQAIMLGLEGSDPETVECVCLLMLHGHARPFPCADALCVLRARTSTINSRYDAIVDNSSLLLGGTHRIVYSMDADMLWRMDALPTHPNGMRFSVFGETGDLLATNEYFSVGGGFVVNQRTQVDENLFYRAINKKEASPARRDQTHGIVQDGPQIAPPQEALLEDEPEPSAANEGESDAQQVKNKQPPFLFHNAQSLETLTKRHNVRRPR